MVTETIEKTTLVERSATELEIMRLLGRWNRESLAKSRQAQLTDPEEKLAIEKIMPFITDCSLLQRGLAENDAYAWKADTFLVWLKQQGIDLPGQEPEGLKQKQIAA